MSQQKPISRLDRCTHDAVERYAHHGDWMCLTCLHEALSNIERMVAFCMSLNDVQGSDYEELYNETLRKFEPELGGE